MALCMALHQDRINALVTLVTQVDFRLTVNRKIEVQNSSGVFCAGRIGEWLASKSR